MSQGLRYSSQYVRTPDGTDLAVDVWRPAGGAGRYPVVLGFTRYWRAYDLGDLPMEYQRLYAAADFFAKHDIVFVMGDVRGSGASFGARSCEYSAAEVEDYGSVVSWVQDQGWCNGDIVAFGVSYGGNAALLATAAGGGGLKAAMPCFIDYDLFQHSICPGGIPNRWMATNWGGMTAALDRNDFKAAAAFQPIPPSEQALAAIGGVKTVDDDTDKTRLAAAIAMHRQNFRSDGDVIEFSDVPLGAGDESVDDISVHGRLDRINASGVPVYCLAGWFDAGTARGALALFANLSVPCQVIIGPWNHGMTCKVDPYGNQHPERQEKIPLAENLDMVVSVLDGRAPSAPVAGRLLRYYTYGLNEWRTTDRWPVAQHRAVPVYCAAAGRLALAPPVQPEAYDRHVFDPAATTGHLNRWHTQIGSTPVIYPDRAQADKTLLTYDTPPLAADCELTGQPSARFFLRCAGPCATFFFYLEDVAPDGRVTMLSEGCFRALHRDGLLDAVAARRLGRRYGFRKGAARTVAPGEIVVIQDDLLPISVVVRRGHRLRLSIAGFDRDTFIALPSAAPAVDVLRNHAHPSHLVLPVVADDAHISKVFGGKDGTR